MPFARLDDAELARRSVHGWCETVAALGRCGPGLEEVRLPNAVGARAVDCSGLLASNHYFDAVVVPYGAAPPEDHSELPHCLWTVAEAPPGHTEVPDYVLPVMGLELDDPALNTSDHDCSPGGSEAPPITIVAAVNDTAHSGHGTIKQLLGALDDARVQTHGIRDPSSGEFICVCLTLGLGDDLSIQFVATKEEHRRRGLASALLRRIMAAAAREGKKTATLQATPAGLGVYARLGFRQVSVLRAYARADDTSHCDVPGGGQRVAGAE